MARADLHDALVVDREIYEASLVDPSLMDPVVRLGTGVPGTARPFVVVRRYQGPQGSYVEQFFLTDRRGREVHRSPTRRIGLEGEMFENRFVTVVSDVRIADAGEHEITFVIDEDEVGSIPVFIQTADGGDPRTAAEETFRSALKKSTILWVSVPATHNGRRGRPAKDHTQAVWYIFDDGVVYLFNGPGEQDVPGLPQASSVELLARSKDLRSLVSRVRCDVEVVPADDERFDKIAKTALTRRLNLPDGDAAYDRWKATCMLLALTPRFQDADDTATAAAAAGVSTAAPPAEVAPSSGTAAEAAPAGAAAPGSAAAKEDVHVEAQLDQEVFDKLVAEGKPERVARAQAKAAYVRREKARIRAEREAS